MLAAVLAISVTLMGNLAVFGLLAAFLFIFWRLLREVWKIHKHCEDYFLKGATLGFFCGIIAIMVHAISANSFIIIRIAEPFWLLAGLILLIPRLGETAEATVPVTVQP